MAPAPGGATEVTVDAGLPLPGLLTIPPDSDAVVVFAHGSGSSRLSRRNQAVAAALHRRGLGTLLFDLLTDEESQDRHLVFAIPLLGERLAAAARWLDAETDAARLGLFGASTGAAAAIVAATQVPQAAAVVSRGGRPDLAGSALGAISVPTLLIVGSRDHEVLVLNESAMAAMTCPVRLEIVPGASHLFEERGALDAVAELAGAWFEQHLTPSRP